MVLPLPKQLSLRTTLSVAALVTLIGLPARGQTQPSGAYPAPSGYYPYMNGAPYGPVPGQMTGSYAPYYMPYQPAQPSGVIYQGSPMMYPPNAGTYPVLPQMPFQPYFCPPHPCLPDPSAPAPVQPDKSGKPTTPSDTTRPERPEQPTDTTPSDVGQNQDANLPDLSSEQGSASGADNIALAAPGGYLDNPIPITTFRLRFDSAYGMNHPDRAEYFYGAWSELGFHPHGIQGKGVFFDPKAVGPNLLPQNVNYQQPDAYLEYAVSKRFSGFVDVPYRMINFQNLQEDNPESETKRNPADQPAPGSKYFPEPPEENEGNPKTSYNGFSDIQFGFKAAILASPTQYLTFQMRVYSPSGNSFQGLGTGHWSVEPSLLLYQRWNRFVLQGQLTDWVPIDGGEAGNVVSYGTGLGYAVYQRGNFSIMPITEFLGWTVLNGYESVFGTISAQPTPGLELPTTHGVLDAGGNTIVNGKFGVRTFFGDGHSLYFGYGRALTGTHWYSDIFTVEYRVFFGANRTNARSL